MKYIVVGCGRHGSGIARALGQREHDVTVIDQNAGAFRRLGHSFKGDTMEGSGLDRNVLIRSGIERCDGLAAATNSDEVNIVAARLAGRFFHVPIVVARLYDPYKAEVYQRLGIQTIAPVVWGIHRAAEVLSRSTLNTLFSLGAGQVDVVEVDVPCSFVGHRVDELNVPGDIHVVALSRGGRTFLPTAGTPFETGDMAYLTVQAASARRLNQLLDLQ